MKSPAKVESLMLARQLGEAAGEPDQALSRALADLVDSEPGNDAERHAREVLTWVLTGMELARAVRAQGPVLHGSTDEVEPEAEAPHVGHREQPHPALRRRPSVVGAHVDLYIR